VSLILSTRLEAIRALVLRRLRRAPNGLRRGSLLRDFERRDIDPVIAELEATGLVWHRDKPGYRGCCGPPVIRTYFTAASGGHAP
jgi:hypothetical protein